MVLAAAPGEASPGPYTGMVPTPTNPPETARVPPRSGVNSALRTGRVARVNSDALLAAAQLSPSAPSASCFLKRGPQPL